MPIASINPATGEILQTFTPLTDAEVQGKLQKAQDAFRRHRQTAFADRAAKMTRAGEILEAEKHSIARTMTMEVGKTLRSSVEEVEKCARACRYYAENAARLLADQEYPIDGARAFVRCLPLGPVLAVMPWNFPLWQVFRFLAPALMAGNVALLKPAPGVPQCALAIEALVRRAGFPRGSMQTLLIETEAVEAVLGDRRVAAVTLTGSEAAGRAVAAQAGYLLKKSVLELGGSDPFIVLPSADLASAIGNAVTSRCINNGQSCIAAKRFVVHAEVYDEFERGFVEGMRAQTVGDPTLEDTDLGPLASAEGAERLIAQAEQAVAAGGRLLTGGKRRPGPGFYVEPTVIAGVPRVAAVYREEIFGPLAFLFRVNSLAEAIELANDTPFGLGASCWTNKPDEQERLARELQAGAVFFNTPVASDPRLPFGGIKQSGYGRELSAAGMREFLNAKTVVRAQPTDSPQQTGFAFTPAAAPVEDPSPAPSTSAAPASQATPSPEPVPARKSTSTLGLSRP